MVEGSERQLLALLGIVGVLLGGAAEALRAEVDLAEECERDPAEPHGRVDGGVGLW
jgi:hypothetical protein